MDEALSLRNRVFRSSPRTSGEPSPIIIEQRFLKTICSYSVHGCAALVTFILCRLRGSEAPIPHLNQVKPVPYEAGNERPRVLLSEQIQRFYSMMNR
ncbi:MAG: hypothetical protein IJI45_17820 [Anaerolineaceae bacterium]|nr:hypothetical protein [Anaerolineaceae bacterium]